MIVMVIMATVAVMVVPRLNSRSSQIKSTVRRLTVVSRQLHDLARLNNAAYRIVFDLRQGGSSRDRKEPQSYWVEKAARPIKLAAKGEHNAISFEDLTKDKDKSKVPIEDFTPDTKVLKNPVELDSPLIVEDIEFHHRETAVTSGRAYVYYFPEGLADEVAIHLSAGKDINWTLITDSLTGRMNVHSEKVSLKDMQQTP